MVIDVGADVTFVTEGDTAHLTAFVQHPQGDDAVVEGVLLGAGDPAEYAVFTRGVNGRWHTEVGWDDAAARGVLNFFEEFEVEYAARFIDAEGREGELSFTLRHHCVSGATACDGVCTAGRC